MAKAHVQARQEFEQLEGAFEAVRAQLIEQLVNTAVGESLLRDKLVLSIQALEMVKTHLINVAQTGDLEALAEELRELK